MTRAFLPTRSTRIARTPRPDRYLGKGAATPFIVHGHRLSSLYRRGFTTQLPFIVLKILKTLFNRLAVRFEYLQNNEAKGGLQHA